MKIIMKKTIYSFCILVFYIISQGCATNFDNGSSATGIAEKSGELAEDEVWEGRIYITDTVIVPDGINLTIRAGTIIGFEPKDKPSQIIVQGELYAEGAPNRMIVIGSLGKQKPVVTQETKQNGAKTNNLQTQSMNALPPQAGDWESILIEAESTNSRFIYCRIQHATYGIISRSDNVQIERCLFTENKIGVLCENTNPTITANEFNRNGCGAQFRGSASPEVEANEFTANRNGLICEDDSRPRISKNIIMSNYENAISCFSTSSPEIISNNITLNMGWAVYDGGRLRDNFISGNKQVGPNITEQSIGTQSEQYYSVDEVFDPRTTPVAEAGVPQDSF